MTERANLSNRPSLSLEPSHPALARVMRAARLTALALTVILILTAFGAAPARATEIRLTISPLALAFPDQEVETTSAAKNVTLTNPNASSLQIDSVVPSGDFTLFERWMQRH